MIDALEHSTTARSDCELIIEDNGTNLRLEPGREGSGRQGLKSENVKNGKSSFGMELDSDILVTASHSDNEHNAGFNLKEQACRDVTGNWLGTPDNEGGDRKRELENGRIGP
ncbi:hypothetical protein L1987_85887 [Smallanthus sonchifolius]|uniref:Uncharacterized protein n=1 Tax=Smallanthus sonchifolius TaxID=185202 RepID=A0ACB8XYK0_9ASTR|nr:hypothetical protein L1987_85887 [Smallanthus sonchifolius]